MKIDLLLNIPDTEEYNFSVEYLVDQPYPPPVSEAAEARSVSVCSSTSTTSTLSQLLPLNYISAENSTVDAVDIERKSDLKFLKKQVLSNKSGKTRTIYLCEKHLKRKEYCKECGGSQICMHNRQKNLW